MLLVGNGDDAPDSIQYEDRPNHTITVDLTPLKTFLQNHEGKLRSMSMAIELSKPFVLLDPVRGLLEDVLKDCQPPKVCGTRA